MRRRTRRAPPPRVADLMRPAVPRAAPGDCLAEVARRMWRDRVGAVVVVSGERLAGIVSERDLLRALADGVDPRTAAVAERMTPAPRTIGPDEPASRAADLMIELGVRHLPVAEDGAVVGMISARDLLQLGRPTPLERLTFEPW